MASSTSAITFNGSSTYSADFQQVLARTVAIASLPMQQMQNHVNDLSNQVAALANLEATFSSLQNSLQNVQAASSASLTATSSAGAFVSAAASSSALAGVYTVAVDNIGSSTTTLSSATLPSVPDATTGNISSSSTFTLTVNGTAHTITPGGNTLLALAQAINASNAGAQATIVNVGATATPDYRLSITSTTLGTDSIQLNDGSTDLLDTLSTGSPALYRVNGGTTQIASSSRQVTLGPGLTANLVQVTTNPVTITVGTSSGALQNALTSLVTQYNNAVDAVTQQRGQTGGALSGQSITFELGNVLHTFSQYSAGSGSIDSLADLGITVNSTGHLTFDSSNLASLKTTDLQQFLGSTTTTGFLKSINDAISSMSDSTNGTLQNAIKIDQDQISNQNDLIAKAQLRITDLQTSLQAQLTKSDAIIANLQAQKTFYTNLFAATYLQNTGISGQ